MFSNILSLFTAPTQSSDQPSQPLSSRSYDSSSSSSTSSASSATQSPFFSEVNPTGVIYSKKDWLDVLRNGSKNSTPYTEIKASLRAGIPRSLVARVWIWLADVKQTRSSFERGIYQRLSTSKNPKWDHDIMKDVHRTMVDSRMFQGDSSIGQQSLYRVLTAFCNIDTSGVGYAQGTNMIVAVILLTLHDPHNFKNPKVSFGKETVSHADIEEWAFWIFYYIMNEKSHHKIYQQNMLKRYQLLDSLRSKVAANSPQVLEILDSNGIEFGLAFDQEFFSILSYKCPLKLSQLAIGMFLLDGHAALIDIIARIIQINESMLLASSAQIDTIIQFLKIDKNRITWEKYANTPHILIPFSSGHQFIQPQSS